MLGRGRKHFVLKLLKTTTRKNLIETYHVVLARKRSKIKSRLALFGRIVLTKGSFYKIAHGILTDVHFFTFDYQRLYKLLSSPITKKIEISPVVKDLLGFTLYASRRKSLKNISGSGTYSAAQIKKVILNRKNFKSIVKPPKYKLFSRK